MSPIPPSINRTDPRRNMKHTRREVTYALHRLRYGKPSSADLKRDTLIIHHAAADEGLRQWVSHKLRERKMHKSLTHPLQIQDCCPEARAVMARYGNGNMLPALKATLQNLGNCHTGPVEQQQPQNVPGHQWGFVERLWRHQLSLLPWLGSEMNGARDELFNASAYLDSKSDFPL